MNPDPHKRMKDRILNTLWHFCPTVEDADMAFERIMQYINYYINTL